MPCRGFGSEDCQLARVRLQSGPKAGRAVRVALTCDRLDPALDPGDDILATEAPAPAEGTPAMAGTGWSHDFQCGSPMLLLTALFVLVVILSARLKGALSLVGLAASLVVLVVFVVPAILDGKPRSPW